MCIDINDLALGFINSYVHVSNIELNLVTTFKLDLIVDQWPFKDESIGAIINVHFFNEELTRKFVRSLKIGGYLLIETIDGRGENYLELPQQGFIKNILGDSFQIRFFKEKKVGPPNSNASTVKLLAIKQKSF